MVHLDVFGQGCSWSSTCHRGTRETSWRRGSGRRRRQVALGVLCCGVVRSRATCRKEDGVAELCSTVREGKAAPREHGRDKEQHHRLGAHPSGGMEAASSAVRRVRRARGAYDGRIGLCAGQPYLRQQSCWTWTGEWDRYTCVLCHSAERSERGA